jgi:hypothetical protein
LYGIILSDCGHGGMVDALVLGTSILYVGVRVSLSAFLNGFPSS